MGGNQIVAKVQKKGRVELNGIDGEKSSRKSNENDQWDKGK